MEPYWSHAACSPFGPDLWFSDDLVDQAEARAICAGCPAAVPCLDGAVRRNEQYGIWAGQLAPFGRRAVRRSYLDGDPLAYQEALANLLTRPERPAGTCHRCGAPTPATDVIDDNPPGATCGKIGTWNRGCRCEGCHGAKLARDTDYRARLREAG